MYSEQYINLLRFRDCKSCKQSLYYKKNTQIWMDAVILDEEPNQQLNDKAWPLRNACKGKTSSPSRQRNEDRAQYQMWRQSFFK